MIAHLALLYLLASFPPSCQSLSLYPSSTQRYDQSISPRAIETPQKRLWEKFVIGSRKTNSLGTQTSYACAVIQRHLLNCAPSLISVTSRCKVSNEEGCKQSAPKAQILSHPSLTPLTPTNTLPCGFQCINRCHSQRHPACMETL